MKSYKSMRNHLWVETYQQPQDDFSELLPEPVAVCDVWGHIETITERQRVQNSLAERVVTHKITTRYDPRIPTDWQTMRLVDANSGRAFNVVGFTNVDELNDRLEFEVAEARD